MTQDDSIFFVVDDDPRVREALSNLLSSMGCRVEVFASASEFIEFDKPDCPGCLILDLQMLGITGLELQQQLLHAQSPPIVFITGHGDVSSSVRAMKNGAIEFLQKPFSDEDLLRAVGAAVVLDRKRCAKRHALSELRNRYASLAPREREVLPFVTSGLLNKQTAGELGIAEITVRVHRGEIMRKMAARSLAELVRMADKLRIS